MAAKFSLIICVVLVAYQVLPSSASCLYPVPPPPAPCVPLPPCAPPGSTITTSNAGSYYSGHAPGPVYVSGPSYVGSGYSSGGAAVYSGPGSAGSSTVYYPAPPAPAPECAVPPVFLPPPKFPQLPTIHAPHPLTIPLQVPSVIPVGRVCVCKSIQIQPSVIPVQKPCLCKPIPAC